jgi:hypothetical protein
VFGLKMLGVLEKIDAKLCVWLKASRKKHPAAVSIDRRTGEIALFGGQSWLTPQINWTGRIAIVSVVIGREFEIHCRWRLPGRMRFDCSTS